MRTLLGALALAASIIHSSARAGQVETLYTGPAHRTIAAFAQDDGLVAWFAPAANSKGCNDVWVWQLGGAQQHLPAEGSGYHNVTCGWQVPARSPVRLAVAENGGSPALLWSLHESAAQSLKFDYVVGATVQDPRERRFQEVAHVNHGTGLWLGGVAGSGSTLVYAVAQVAYKNQLDCLSAPQEPGACDLMIAGGGVYRVVGRKAPVPIKHAPAAVAIAASGGDVALVPAVGTSTSDGHPLASPSGPVEVRDAVTGSVVTSISPDGTPIAVALSGSALAVLSRSAGAILLSWYDPTSGNELGSLTLPAGTAPELSAGDGTLVFRVGRSIRAVDTATKQIRTITKAAATPIGLSIAGKRIAWAENVDGRARIRAYTLAP